MSRLIKNTALGLGALVMSVSASATILFSDDFESESATGSVLNYDSFNNWVVRDGTVDLIKSGPNPWFDPNLGDGFFVDLDGSTYDAGRMVSRQSFAFESGVHYRLSFDLAGNSRNASEDWVRSIVTMNGVAGEQHANEVFKLGGNEAFTTYALDFYGEPTNESGRIVFRTDFPNQVNNNYPNQNDNIGLLLDNVVLESVDVAEPGNLGLMSLGLLGLAFVRRKMGKSA